MKIKELIKELKKLDQESLVVMSKDGEGNGFSPLSDMSEEFYCPDSKYSGESYAKDEDEIPEGSVDCIVLWPTN